MSTDREPVESTDRKLQEYKLVRDEIHAEHVQINSRMGWFVAHQTVLIGATAALLTSDFFGQQPQLVFIPSLLIAVIGLLLAVSLSSSLSAAIHKVEILRTNERRFLPESHSLETWKERLKCRKEWVKLLEKPNSDVPPWYIGSTEDINRAGFRYPQRAPKLVVLLWVVIMAVSCQFYFFVDDAQKMAEL